MPRIIISSSTLPSLDERHHQILEHFFLRYSQNPLWQINSKYLYPYQGISYEIVFTEYWLRRNRKKDPGVRYEIFDDAQNKSIGSGGFGAVYPVIATVKIEHHKLLLKTHKPRIIKISNVSEPLNKEISKNEHLALTAAQHLSVKEPVHYGKYTYLVMKRAKGVELLQILNQPELLSINKRKELSLAIIDAIEEQVTSKGLIHRDLKPENIIIDMSQQPVKATIIDYGFGLINSQGDGYPRGSPAYCSPETLQLGPYTPKSDCYSLGRILALLWGDPPSNYDIDLHPLFSFERDIAPKSTNINLFTDPNVRLFKLDEEVLRECINKLMHKEPDQRSSLQEARESFLRINWEKYEEEHIKQMSKAGVYAYERQLIDEGFQPIEDFLFKLREKRIELSTQGYYNDAIEINKLYKKLSQTIDAYHTTPSQITLQECHNTFHAEMKQYSALLKKHMDNKWHFGGWYTLLGLLGVGCVIATYAASSYRNDRFGLFSQSDATQATDSLWNAIKRVMYTP